MAHRKTAAAILCLVVLSSAAILLPAYRQKARQRKLAQDAAQYRAAAAHGDADAQYRLGSISYYGQGAPQDYTEAVRWYRKAAGQGSAVAQYALAYCYFHGRGVSRDSAETVRWLRKAADQGYVAAENRLGDMYARGDGLPRDYVEAVRWSRRACCTGDAECWAPPEADAPMAELTVVRKATPRPSTGTARQPNKVTRPHSGISPARIASVRAPHGTTYRRPVGI